MEVPEQLRAGHHCADIGRAFGASHRAAGDRSADGESEPETAVPQVAIREACLPSRRRASAAVKEAKVSSQPALARRRWGWRWRELNDDWFLRRRLRLCGLGDWMRKQARAQQLGGLQRDHILVRSP